MKLTTLILMQSNLHTRKVSQSAAVFIPTYLQWKKLSPQGRRFYAYQDDGYPMRVGPFSESDAS